METTIKIKRIYEPPQKTDGIRILVDRLWPRGIKKDEAQLNDWIKDLAPTAKLRKWFNYDPEKWNEFAKLYKKELKENDVVTNFIASYKNKKNITLLYAAKDEKNNNAIVLKSFLEHYL